MYASFNLHTLVHRLIFLEKKMFFHIQLILTLILDKSFDLNKLLLLSFCQKMCEKCKESLYLFFKYQTPNIFRLHNLKLIN